MKKIFFLLLIPFMLQASKILSYNVYERTNQVDIVFTFDIPYEGVVSQDIQDGKLVIKLDDATIESEKTKLLNSQYISKFVITPLADHTQIVADVPSDIEVQASKTADSYELRLRFNKGSTTIPSDPNSTNSIASLPTQVDIQISTGYYIVILVLLATLGFVFYLKKKMNTVIPEQKNVTPPTKPSKKSWILSSENEVREELQVRFSKQLDQVNKIIMIDYGHLSYLIITGQSNILLDKFEDNKPLNKNDFEELLKERNDELNALLNLCSKEKEPFQTYKEKAATIAYDSYDA